MSTSSGKSRKKALQHCLGGRTYSGKRALLIKGLLPYSVAAAAAADWHAPKTSKSGPNCAAAPPPQPVRPTRLTYFLQEQGLTSQLFYWSNTALLQPGAANINFFSQSFASKIIGDLASTHNQEGKKMFDNLIWKSLALLSMCGPVNTARTDPNLHYVNFYFWQYGLSNFLYGSLW